MSNWYPDLIADDDIIWPRYHRFLVAHVDRSIPPWTAACRIVKEIWQKAPHHKVVTYRDVKIYRESCQRLALDIEVGRAELAYERSLMS